MSFYTSVVTSYFPENFKLRKDSSSVGSRMYSTISDALEDVYYENYILRRFATFYNPIRQVEHLWEVQLDPKDSVDIEEEYSFPVVIVNGDYFEKVFTSIEFLEKHPFSISIGEETIVQDWLIWSSTSPKTFNPINESEHLMVDCTQLGEFIGSDKFSQRELQFFDNYEITIRGRDELYNEIEERIGVIQKEVYITNKTFKQVDSVEWDGFEGNFNIYLSSKKQSYKKFPMEYNYIHNFGKTSNTKLSLIQDNNKSYFRTEQMFYRNAIFYSSFSSLENQKDMFLLDQVIVDDSGNYVNLIDFAKCPNNKYYYGLDDNNTVHCFETTLKDLEPMREKSYKSNFLRFVDLQNRVGLFEEIEFGLDFKSFIGGIESYRIKRYSPLGVKEYYQANGSWGASVHEFTFSQNLRYRDRAGTISFNNYFDKEGQWEFYIEAKYKEFEEREILSTGVICEYLKALKSYTLNYNGNFDGIFFDKKSILSVSENSKYWNLEFQYKRFSYSPLENRLVFLSEVDEIEFLLPTKISFYRENYLVHPKLNNIERETMYLKKGERHCFVQEFNSSWSEELFFSEQSERTLAVSNVEIIPEYYIDGIKYNSTEYSNRIANGNYDIIEIIVPKIEADRIYCYSRTSNNFKITINLIDKDIFKRLDDNYGYV